MNGFLGTGLGLGELLFLIAALGRVAKGAGEPVESRGEAEAGVVVAGELV